MIGALSPVYARSTNDAINLLQDAFPASAVGMLPEWESTLGLPDPCDGATPTLQTRQSAVLTKFSETGGQSIPYFTGYLAKLGFSVTFTEFAPFRFGSTFGNALNGDAWAYALQINAPLYTVQKFTFGLSGFGEPFASWSNTLLECEMQEISPAHVDLIFSYT